MAAPYKFYQLCWWIGVNEVSISGVLENPAADPGAELFHPHNDEEDENDDGRRFIVMKGFN